MGFGVSRSTKEANQPEANSNSAVLSPNRCFFCLFVFFSNRCFKNIIFGKNLCEFCLFFFSCCCCFPRGSLVRLCEHVSAWCLPCIKTCCVATFTAYDQPGYFTRYKFVPCEWPCGHARCHHDSRYPETFKDPADCLIKGALIPSGGASRSKDLMSPRVVWPVQVASISSP